MAELFTVLFYGLKDFCCKITQFCATRRESEIAETPSVDNDVQRSENARKNSLLNYKFPTLFARQIAPAYLLKADLPEMKKDDVRVTVEDGILSVSGERKSEKEDQKKKFHRIERSFGNFRRGFTLPEDADSTKVTAEFRDGVLKVHLPTTTIAKSKALEVKVQ